MGKKRKGERKNKANKYDNLSKPEAEFDFHNRGVLTRQMMQDLADEFLNECRDRKLSKVLFITGKGLHSKKGMPVIKPFLKKYLCKLENVMNISSISRNASIMLHIVIFLLQRSGIIV